MPPASLKRPWRCEGKKEKKEDFFRFDILFSFHRFPFRIWSLASGVAIGRLGVSPGWELLDANLGRSFEVATAWPHSLHPMRLPMQSRNMPYNLLVSKLKLALRCFELSRRLFVISYTRRSFAQGSMKATAFVGLMFFWRFSLIYAHRHLWEFETSLKHRSKTWKILNLINWLIGLGLAK